MRVFIGSHEIRNGKEEECSGGTRVSDFGFQGAEGIALNTSQVSLSMLNREFLIKKITITEITISTN
jgi:hypothetical protein